MYALENVRKFLVESGLVSRQRQDILLARAYELATEDDIIMAGMTEQLWTDLFLKERFFIALQEPEHTEIALRVMRARGRPSDP